MRTGHRVLIETSPGVLVAATVVAPLPDGWVRAAIDGETVIHDWHAERVIDPRRIIDIAVRDEGGETVGLTLTELIDGPCDDCGRPEHDGECGGWEDTNEALGVSLGAGSY
jgi:hypothetical protein